MVSALARKSLRDLSRRRARTVFTVLTIALGVAGMSMLAVSGLADRGMHEQIEQSRMYNVNIHVTDVDLNATNMRELGEIPNVKAVDARATMWTRMYIGERRAYVILVGVEDFTDQRLDIITRESGRLPGPMEALSEESNSRNGVYGGGAGDVARVVGSNGTILEIGITGTARSLVYAPDTNDGIVVLYTGIQTARAVGNLSGYTSLSFQLADQSKAAVDRTVEDVRDYLTSQTSVVAFDQLPHLRAGDDWAQKEVFNNILSSLAILTVIILLASAFLISNTMNTIISEQKREIGQMKAIGATSRQVFTSFLTTSLVIGAIGAAVGAVLGVLISYEVLVTFSRPFGMSFGFMVDVPTVLLSLVVGVGVVLLASLPALVRSARVSVREALESSGISASYGEGALDRLLMGGRRLPRTVQMGIRNVARKKGRSVATLLQITLAVALFMGMLSLAQAVSVATEMGWAPRTFDVRIEGTVPAELVGDIAAMEGVSSIDQYVSAKALIGSHGVEIWGYSPDTHAWDHRSTMSAGRWFTDEDNRTNASVMVVGTALASLEDIEVGDRVHVMLATGDALVEVVGLQDSFLDSGQSVLMPIGSLQHLLRDPSNSGLFIQTTTDDHGAIDRLSVDLEDYLEARGVTVGIMIHYVSQAQDIASNNGTVMVFMFVSMLVVLICMIGLMSTLTMNVLDRTKEIGMLRCIGARARDIRRMFSTEGLFLALVGWGVGLPLGGLIGFFLQAQIKDTMRMQLPVYYAWAYIPWAFLVTVVGTLLVIQVPMLRATRFKPGDALRYQ